jgi:hypothetical protein
MCNDLDNEKKQFKSKSMNFDETAALSAKYVTFPVFFI